jgi:Leucine-rich repeat (LRR) protein
MELFVKGEEEPLDDERRLSAADKVPLFMLPKAASDRVVLEALFKSCGGADWTRKDGWMTEAALGEWYGVKVDAEGRVVELSLNFNNLAGALPSEIQQLSALTELGLSGNKLTGAIPAELGQLGALKSLYLSGNQLSEVIPAELARLPALASLYLMNNHPAGQLSGHEAFRSQMQEHNPECKLVLVPEDLPQDDFFFEEEDSESRQPRQLRGDGL